MGNNRKTGEILTGKSPKMILAAFDLRATPRLFDAICPRTLQKYQLVHESMPRDILVAFSHKYLTIMPFEFVVHPERQLVEPLNGTIFS